MNNSNKIIASILGASIVISGLAVITSHHDDTTKTLASLQKELTRVNEETKKIKSDNQSTEKNPIIGTTLYNAQQTGNDLMTNLYSWSSSKDYNENKTSIIKNDITDPNLISQLMPDDKDISGNSKIDAYNIKSKLVDATAYTQDINSGDVYLVAEATSEKKSQNNSDNNLSAKYLYKAHYDTNAKRFNNLSYIGKESLSASSGN